MLLLLLALLGVAAVAAGSSSSSSSSKGSFVTESSGGVVRIAASQRPAILAYLKTRIATLVGAPTQGVPTPPLGVTVMLVDPPRPSSSDTMPADQWFTLAESQGYIVLMTFDGLLAAVTISEVPRWASIGGRWVVLSAMENQAARSAPYGGPTPSPSPYPSAPQQPQQPWTYPPEPAPSSPPMNNAMPWLPSDVPGWPFGAAQPPGGWGPWFPSGQPPQPGEQILMPGGGLWTVPGEWQEQFPPGVFPPGMAPGSYPPFF